MSSLEHDFDLGGTEPVARTTSHTVSWLDRMGLATKLRISIFGSAMLMGSVALAIFACLAYFSSTGQKLIDLATVEVSTVHAALELGEANEAIRAYQDSADAETLSEVSSGLLEANHYVDDIFRKTRDRLDPETMASVEGFASLLSDLDQQFQALGTTPSRAKTEAFSADLVAAKTQMNEYSKQVRERISTPARELLNGLFYSLIAAAIVLAIGIAATVASVRTMIRNVVGKIGEITDVMTRVAGGKADVRIPGLERHDEIGAMARSLAVFREDALKLAELNAARMEEAEAQLVQQQLMSDKMRELRSDKSRLLENLARDFEVSVGELITAVSAASQQLKSTSKDMGRLAEDSEEQAKDATEAMDSANANVTAAAAASDEFALSISEISRQASSSASLAREATQLVSTANTRMSDLSLAADEIGEIAGLIQTIAQRTNLLALNASIEAARGGEAGRGFAVVASEVKELAMQTSNATSSVAERIAAMQATTKSSASDLTSIVSQIAEVERAAAMIASAVDQQSASGEELARNIDTVAVGTGQISQRLSALRKASEDTGTAADDVVASADALSSHADDLRTKAGRFIEDVRRSARELEAGDAA